MKAVSGNRHDRVLWRLGVLVAYPALVWAAVGFEAEWLRAITFPLLALALIGGLPATRAGATLMLGAIALALATLLAPGLALWPAGLICLGMAGWFAFSLASGEPLIGRFADEICRQAGRNPPADSASWFRVWTLVWSVILTCLGAGAVLLAIVDRPQAWLVWVAGVIPGSCLVVFLAEFFLRPLRFPDEPRWSLAHFLVHMARVRPGQLAR
ncbi:MAG: hypothetical protein ACOCSR_01830 [Wenzhouxiangella sp.]